MTRKEGWDEKEKVLYPLPHTCKVEQ